MKNSRYGYKAKAVVIEMVVMSGGGGGGGGGETDGGHNFTASLVTDARNVRADAGSPVHTLPSGMHRTWFGIGCGPVGSRCVPVSKKKMRTTPQKRRQAKQVHEFSERTREEDQGTRTREQKRGVDGGRIDRHGD